MRVAIVGAGLAGLAAGCELADAGHDVVLLERRPWAGGKTYSFSERETGEQVDNGQHIAMRCTTAYVRFLERIGSAHLVKWQPRMRVPVFDADGRRSVLRADPLPAPLHLLPSFAVYRHLALAEKARVARGIVAITRAGERPGHATQSFGAWLRAHGQSERAIRDFWDVIVVPTLNCRCDDASAQQAIFVFHEGFLRSPAAAAIGVPKVGLTRLHVEPAVRYIEQRGGEVRTGTGVEGIDVRDGEVAALLLTSGERVACDACIAALPPRELLDVLPAEMRGGPPFDALADVRTSPIVNLHLWFDGPVADFDFAAFTGCDLQWAFNRTRIAGEAGAEREHLVISLSAAARFMPLDKQELQDLLLPQLRRALPAAAHRTLLRCVAIKEPAATFVPAPGLRRPGARTPVANLFPAGDYPDTGWPATMESAVRSGIAAAAAVAATARTSEPRQMAPVA